MNASKTCTAAIVAAPVAAPAAVAAANDAAAAIAAAITAMLGDTPYTGAKFEHVCAVFDEANAGAHKFAERLGALGLADRAQAKPVAMAWASRKYGVAIEKGQRGFKLPASSAADKAMHTVLSVCFPREESVGAKINAARASAAAVTLTRAQRKAALAFLAEFDGETLNAQITAARAGLASLKD